jgi:O-methyltransferase
MNKYVFRHAKYVFMRWNLHVITEPFSHAFLFLIYLGKLSKWRKQIIVKGYNDFYKPSTKYERRFTLYQEVAKAEKLDGPIDYFEFGVAGGNSFKWWLQYNQHPGSRFLGFDTFDGLPEKWGPFARGAMSHALDSLAIHDPRACFYKGLFQDTLVPFLEAYQSKQRKLVHMDADLFSSSIFVLSQLYRFLNDGDILLFDEFAVPLHEFQAWKIFTESFYIDYEVIGAANNYLFLAVKIRKK